MINRGTGSHKLLEGQFITNFYCKPWVMPGQEVKTMDENRRKELGRWLYVELSGLRRCVKLRDEKAYAKQLRHVRNVRQLCLKENIFPDEYYEPDPVFESEKPAVKKHETQVRKPVIDWDSAKQMDINDFIIDGNIDFGRFAVNF